MTLIIDRPRTTLEALLNPSFFCDECGRRFPEFQGRIYQKDDTYSELLLCPKDEKRAKAGERMKAYESRYSEADKKQFSKKEKEKLKNENPKHRRKALGNPAHRRRRSTSRKGSAKKNKVS